MVFFLIFLINAAYAEDTDINSTIIDDNFDSIQNLIYNANSGDSIYLENKTYYGNGSAINIDRDISIYGSGSSNTILNANNKSSIFTISKDVSVNLIGLTFTNGNAFKDDGGAIYNLGTLTIINSTISNNSAYGGAIHCDSHASLTVHDSLFDSNHAALGAAIDNYNADLKIYNSTFINNECNEGGAIYNRIANFWIYDSVFMNNKALRGGGVYNNKGLMKIYNSKFYSNSASHLGGGIKSFGDCEVYDSIIKNNTGYQGGGLFVSQNTMKINNCIIEDNNAYEGGGFFTDVKATLIIKGTSISNNSATTDGGGINVYQGYLTLTNSNLTNNYAPELGGGIFYSDYPYTSTISDLILTNNSAKYGGGIYVGTLTAKMSNIKFIDNFAIDGGAIYNNGDLTLKNINFDSNRANNNGGAIYAKQDLTVSDSIAIGNNALGYGGVVYSTANLNVNNFNFSSNEAKFAGAIYCEKPTKISNSNFDANKAYDTGAIYSLSDLTVDNCNFTNHQTTNTYGGVMFLSAGNVNITGALFSNNKGADEGGSIFNDIANVYINNTKFLSNKAKSYGAAIDNSGNLTVENSVFDKNMAYGAGAIDNSGDLKVINSNFTNNKATNNGGAIDNVGNMVVLSSIFENNTANNDGGAIMARRNIDVSYSIFFNNHDKNGYAIFNDSWQENSISNNWWGSNNPNFNELLNFNVSDDFNWVIMSVTNTTPLIQGKAGNIVINLSNVLNSKGSVSRLDCPALLPIFKVALSNGEVFSVGGGSIEKSISIPVNSTISSCTGNQSFTLKIAINPDSIKRIINNKNVVVDYCGKATFKVRVIGDDGNPVGKGVVIVMKVGKTSYKATTDSNGYASKTFTFTPGKYTVTTTYKKYSVKNTLTIKKVLTAKSATKKKAKYIKYSAYLKTSKGKPISGKKVTFKIKGKTYSAKTNKKGVATVTFKYLKVGQYSLVVKYLNSQVKTTLKVKR